MDIFETNPLFVWDETLAAGIVDPTDTRPVADMVGVTSHLSARAARRATLIGGIPLTLTTLNPHACRQIKLVGCVGVGVTSYVRMWGLPREGVGVFS